ncbi:uncharacterized protein LOC136076765 isoform X3 [Hydra vulgaris]|uniref:Uncharacterized protein LOC136076765 isoform X3 n=1 Tax=Hydra vulgaris TaxID=6087 RepID=A0ABM4BBH0_HYDVU
MLDQKKKVKLEKEIANAVDTATLVRSFINFITNSCKRSEVKDALELFKTELSTMNYYDDVKEDIYDQMKDLETSNSPESSSDGSAKKDFLNSSEITCSCYVKKDRLLNLSRQSGNDNVFLLEAYYVN